MMSALTVRREGGLILTAHTEGREGEGERGRERGTEGQRDRGRSILA